jgi:ribosomal protein L11 methylase PrmA
MSSLPTFNPGSFRDPEGRVFSANGRIFRTLSPAAADRMRKIEKDGRLKNLVDSKRLIPSWTTDSRKAELEPSLVSNLLLEQEKLDLVTYPYEWSFGMLKDAALLTLDLLENALDAGIILKDATPFNVTLHKNRMVFFDTLSLDDYEDGRPWDGYSQFCREFLFPLMLTSSTGVPFQPWMRGELNGLKAPYLSKLLGLGRARHGVLTHVHLQAWFENWLSKKGDIDLRKRFDKKSFSKSVVLRMIRKLRKIVDGLKGRSAASLWGGYETSNSYGAEDEKKKTEFVAAAGRVLNGGAWIDVGCNNGKYLMTVGGNARIAVGLDLDPTAVDGFYRRIKNKDGTSYHPVVCDLMNPSPSLGWRLTERPSLFERLRGDAFLALAVVHHLCIGANVPLPEFVSLLKSFGRGGVVEWVDKKDAMVRRLLRNRVDVFPDYTWENFRSLLEKNFVLKETCDTHQGARRLCLVLPKETV